MGGGGGCSWFHKVTFTEVMEFLTFDLVHNDVVVLGATVMRQCKGIAIGGTTSAQVASAYCAVRKNLFYSHVQPWD